jgi:hypothetical protein
MSQDLINPYLADRDRLKRVSGEDREGIVSAAFKDLLKGWGRQRDLVFVPQFKLNTLPTHPTDTPETKTRAAGLSPKCILNSEPGAGVAPGRIVIDSQTVLVGVPAGAWRHQLGNRSAIDWVLDQHKDEKPKDPTIRERFDTYSFADHKERVIDLLARVVRVSGDTVGIIEGMKGGPR